MMTYREFYDAVYALATDKSFLVEVKAWNHVYLENYPRTTVITYRAWIDVPDQDIHDGSISVESSSPELTIAELRRRLARSREGAPKVAPLDALGDLPAPASEERAA
jgi:hypothetical protein